VGVDVWVSLFSDRFSFVQVTFFPLVGVAEEILSNTSCRHIRKWIINLFQNVASGDYGIRLGLGYAMVGGGGCLTS
jgi:hypothetical protein